MRETILTDALAQAEQGLLVFTPQQAAEMRARLRCILNHPGKPKMEIPAGMNFLGELRNAARLARKNPGFALLVVITLALGIGANSALFTVVDAVLLKPLPYREPDQLVVIWERNPQLGVEQQRVSPANFLDWQSQNHVFERLAFRPGWNGSEEFNLSNAGGTERIRGSYASSGLFPVLGVHPVLGRTFLPDEDRREGNRVAILSYSLWQRAFGGDPNILGRSITVDSFEKRDYQVVGVMPRAFSFPDKSELWLPAGWMGIPMDRRTSPWLEVIARLRPGISVDQARSELDGIQGQIARTFPNSRVSSHVQLVPLLDQAVGRVRPTLLILLGAVGFVLLIACSNVANLLLARSAARQHEIAVRSAVGASRMRIMRQLLSESLLLAVVSGILGILLASLGIRLLRVLGPQDIPRLARAAINARVLGFTVLLSLASSVIFGLAPAWHLAKSNLSEWLKDGGRTSAGSARLTQWRNLLIVGETALTIVLLIGAGLMVHSLWRLARVDPGFTSHGLVTVKLDLSSSRYSNSRRAGPNRPQIFTHQLLARLSSMPGVEASAAASSLPPTTGSLPQTFAIEGRSYHGPADLPTVTLRAVTPGYFHAMGIPILRGRAFTDSDTETAPEVVIINETVVRRYFAVGEDPIRKRIDLAAQQQRGRDGRIEPWWNEIIGVVGDVKNAGLAASSEPEAYKPDMQFAWHWAYLVMRTNTAPDAVVAALRTELRKMSPDTPISEVRTAEQILGDELAQPRFRSVLIVLFAVLALVLAAVGIYGVMSYAVSRRTNEIGIRLALGAQRSHIMWLVLSAAMKLVLAGALIGIAGAAAISRLFLVVLFEVSPLDPVTFAGIPFFLLTVALVATYIPARRATRVDPLTTLRFE
jgi:putative ABC transport system permease protein